MMAGSAQYQLCTPAVIQQTTGCRGSSARIQSHCPSFQQTNEAGDAETLQWENDLMDVRLLPY